MARTYAKLKGSIWRDHDWRTLPASHQRLYLLLFSQPEISNCGVLPYLPAKWARMAADTSQDSVEGIAAELQAARFIVVDEESCEVLIRTYVKHDKILEQPQIKAAAVRQFDGIHSIRIRTVLSTEYPEAFQLQPHETANPEPYGQAAPTLLEGSPQALRARSPVNVTRQPPPAPVNDTQQPAPNDSAEHPAAETLERLRAAGWSNGQLDNTDLDRAVAWLNHYQADPTAKKPAALAWTKYSSSDTWPDKPRTEIAPGAVGTRSSSPPQPTRPREPEPEPAPPPKDFLALAGRTSEPPPPPESRARETQPEESP